MPISASAGEAYADYIRRVYIESQIRMLMKVAKRIERGIDSPGWAEKKLAEIQDLRRDIESEVGKLKVENPGVESAIEDSYKLGVDEAAADLRHYRLTDIANVDPSKYQGIRALAKSAVNALDSTHFRILRVVQDEYREVVARSSSQVLTGTLTRRQAAQDALNKFADRGITGFVDKAGRKWDLASYAEMSVRSATGQAAVQGHVDKLSTNGRDLVIVSDHAEECPLCRPYENKVLSISGTTPGYETVSQATAAGLFHPSCSHSLGLWIEGVTRPREPQGTPEDYEERQRQRYNERQIRKWKSREAVANEDSAKRQAAAKVAEWQKAHREFVAETDRRRDYGRESITRAR